MSLFSAGQTLASCQRASPLNALETRLLLSHSTGLTRIQLITQSESQLTEEQAQALSAIIQKRLDGIPIAYLLGEREFYGLLFKVTPAVLIPRPETELLVELGLTQTPKNGRLLDLGTGSGAIAIAIAAQRPDIDVSAADISTDALAVARLNAETLIRQRAAIQFYVSDWYQSIPPQTFQTIISNPPYIVKGDTHLSEGDLRFEPIDALTDHADGLSAYRQIIAGAATYLELDGWLLMEHGYDQAELVQELLGQHHFQEVQSWPDLAGILRVTGGKKRKHEN
jgi:release factor glutamine methyltransferase